MDNPKPLPWHLVEAETTWQELVAPFLDAALELVTQQFIYATTEAERAICQGQMLALRNIKDAPDNAKYIKDRAERIEQDRLKSLEENDGRHRNSRPTRRR